jgi:hypothetical protein
VTGNQDIVAFGGCTVLGVVDLFVCSVHPDAQHLDEDAATVRDIVDARFWQICQVEAVGLARNNGHRFRHELSFSQLNYGCLKIYSYRMLGVAALLIGVSSSAANRLLSDSASVGCAKTPSRRAV